MGWPVRHAGKEDKQVQKFLQKLEGVSQALLDPLSYLTAAGLLLVVGALLTSSPLRQLLPVLNWTPICLAGGLLYNSMMAIITRDTSVSGILRMIMLTKTLTIVITLDNSCGIL